MPGRTGRRCERAPKPVSNALATGSRQAQRDTSVCDKLRTDWRAPAGAVEESAYQTGIPAVSPDIVQCGLTCRPAAAIMAGRDPPPAVVGSQESLAALMFERPGCWLRLDEAARGSRTRGFKAVRLERGGLAGVGIDDRDVAGLNGRDGTPKPPQVTSGIETRLRTAPRRSACVRELASALGSVRCALVGSGRRLDFRW